MPQEPVHSLNGQLIPESQLKISPRDIGILRGYGVFDYLITYPVDRPFHLPQHIDRLFHSAELIGLRFPWSKETIQQWVIEALKANSDGQQRAIRIVATGGIGPDSITPSNEQPTLIIFIEPHSPLPAEYYQTGAGVITHEFTRYLPESKTTNYLEGVKLTKQARAQGGVEVVYYDQTQVFEGATSNIFAVIDGRLMTPKTKILAGITRMVILEKLAIGSQIVVEDFSIDQLRKASEVFLTASNKEVLPITKIDGQPVGNGQVGPQTQEVMRQFREYTQSDKW